MWWVSSGKGRACEPVARGETSRYATQNHCVSIRPGSPCSSLAEHSDPTEHRAQSTLHARRAIKAKKRARAVPGRATQPCRLEHVRDKVEISSRGFLQPPALSFGESPPDTEAFIMLQRILQALRSYLARLADLLRLPCRAALLGKERLRVGLRAQGTFLPAQIFVRAVRQRDHLAHAHLLLDRKSTRLNSSHVSISYAVFCLKKK